MVQANRTMVWSQVGGEYVCGRYAIHRRCDGSDRPWQLDVVAPEAKRSRVQHIVEGSRHCTLQDAQSAADDLESWRVRNLRACLHLGLAFGAGYVFVLLTASELTNLSSFAVAVVALGIAVRSLGNAVGAKRRDLWGWQPDAEANCGPSPFERLCTALICRSTTALSPGSSVRPDQVRVLPPTGTARRDEGRDFRPALRSVVR